MFSAQRYYLLVVKLDTEVQVLKVPSVKALWGFCVQLLLVVGRSSACSLERAKGKEGVVQGSSQRTLCQAG